MTSAEIRQSFLDFFREKEHTIVPSGSLLPDSPNLLFTNAGMNQFVPIFLGQQSAPWSPPRTVDTQKCIRAGGKHNDLDDVGLDTYHHTFFEMLGNWSFGDYFKKEAIAWSWELIVERFKFPANRVYATIYQPDPGEPSVRDQEAYDLWAEKFRSAGLDPAVHIVDGNKNDNFWMMGETGPCGPCSEIHIDLTPEERTPELELRGSKMVNAGVPECIEIWNNVFIQFNANPDGTFTPLPAQHVDTGMGFERLTSIIQGTKGFTDFANAKISNYETDIFRPIFDELEKMSGHRYGSTLPESHQTKKLAERTGFVVPTASGVVMTDSDGISGKVTDQIAIDVAFRVIADHIRTLSFARADEIPTGNTDRNYVLRRILRRAVRYGRSLGFQEPFLHKLVPVLAREFGEVFPEIRAKQKQIKEMLLREEEAFNKTLDRGLEIFNLYVLGFEEAHHRCNILQDELLSKESGQGDFIGRYVAFLQSRRIGQPSGWDLINGYGRFDWAPPVMTELMGRLRDASSAKEASDLVRTIKNSERVISGDFAFKLYDTYGFPLDLTELMARERGLTVDTAGFEKYMATQRARARAAQKKTVIELSEVETKDATHFLGYDYDHTGADVQEVLSVKGKTVVIANNSVCYAEMGGQVGDTGEMTHGGNVWRIAKTQKSGHTWLHFLDEADAPAVGDHVTVKFETARRRAIERHHTVTHLLHWALHEIVSREAAQKGSYVGPEKLTFDFNHAALTPPQVIDVERLVNERIVENDPVSWREMPYDEVKGRPEITQFFGDKYGDTVRVVQIGGERCALDGYSMELCGGTHVRGTGEIGLFRIVSESAIAAGVRRVEAVAGLQAYDAAKRDLHLIKSLAGKLNSPVADLEKRIEAMLAQQKALEKSMKALEQKQAVETARELIAKAQSIGTTPVILENLGAASGDQLQAITDALKQERFKGVAVLAGAIDGSVALAASVAPEFTSKIQAGKIIQSIATIVGGKGGGRPEHARGAGKDASKIDEALAQVRALLA
ncbi:MAG: alanine--tRNA ligase [Verrucomicrobiota bacterium]|nr:alanine--tRNA ligase [Verrucomicrobiota bacterium]